MRQVSGVILPLNQADLFHGIRWREPFPRYDRRQEDQHLAPRQSRSPFFRCCCTRTRKWWARMHSVMWWCQPTQLRTS